MEGVAVVLRKGGPIRFGEAPRSWAGASPTMPEGTEWPRDDEGAPLHFVVQIACADLRNSRGPRNGWFDEEFERRAAGRREFQDPDVRWDAREAARDAPSAEIAAERRAGWIERAFGVLEAKRVRLEARRDEYRRKLDEADERWLDPSCLCCIPMRNRETATEIMITAAEIGPEQADMGDGDEDVLSISRSQASFA